MQEIAKPNMSKKEQIQEWTARISAIVEAKRNLDKACNAAIDAGTMDINGPLFNAVWTSFESMIDLVDFEGWIQWFVYDNECGKKGMEASGGRSPTRPIRTPAQLARLIVEAQNPTWIKQ